MRLAAVAVVAAVLSWMPALPAPAQDAKLEVRASDTVKTVLERQMGRRVGLVLTVGPEMSGVVAAVGDRVVHLSELTGRDFFDAVVPIEHIASVIVRVRGR